MRHLKTPPVLLCGALLGALVCSTPALAAQTFAVDSTLDEVDDNTGDGVCHTASATCSLRAAIMQANRSTGAGAIIHLPAGTYTLTRLPENSNGEDSGDLNLTTPATGNPTISIVGASTAATFIDAARIDRVFAIESSRTANISDLTLRNGFKQASYGGGIHNRGTLTLENVVVTGNSANAGGGIHNYGPLTIWNCAIVANAGGSAGGGVFTEGSMRMTGSTIAYNTARFGGGLVTLADVILINSTIAANEALRDGGGIYSPGAFAINIYNSTIAYNGADFDHDEDGGSGGGIFSASSSVNFNLRSTLVAGNHTGNTPMPDDCIGPVNSYAFNLFGNTDGCQLTAVTGSWDLLNSLDFLGGLASHGGPTETIALLPGSSAIDNAILAGGCLDDQSSPIVSDQRGFARADGACDIGAFEYGASNPADTIFANGFELAN